MSRITKNGIFACFSPPVMIATFIVEVLLIAHMLITRKINKTVQIAALLLTSLAIFQLAEYGVCEQLGLSGNTWARIGFVAITMLPPLGLHLVYNISKTKSKAILPLAYALASIWAGIFLFGGIMGGQVCDGNYVIFEISNPAEIIYYVYYDFFVIVALYKGFRLMHTVRLKRSKTALKFLMIGYLAFIIPSVVVRLLFDFNDAKNSALPSILCGFAVILAVLISVKVIPNTAQKRKS